MPTVFLEVTGPPDYQITDGPGQIVITLRGTTVPVRNNLRPLEVRFFDTHVTEVTTKKAGRDVRVTIRTKDSGRPGHKERVEPAAGGFQLLVVELPPQS